MIGDANEDPRDAQIRKLTYDVIKAHAVVGVLTGRVAELERELAEAKKAKAEP